MEWPHGSILFSATGRYLFHSNRITRRPTIELKIFEGVWGKTCSSQCMLGRATPRNTEDGHAITDHISWRQCREMFFRYFLGFLARPAAGTACFAGQPKEILKMNV